MNIDNHDLVGIRHEFPSPPGHTLGQSFLGFFIFRFTGEHTL